MIDHVRQSVGVAGLSRGQSSDVAFEGIICIFFSCLFL